MYPRSLMSSALQQLVDRWYAEQRPAPLQEPIATMARPLAMRAAATSGAVDGEVEDIAQHAVERFVKQLHRRDKRVDHADALLWRIAENKAKDGHRRRKRRDEGTERLLHDPTAFEDGPSSPERLYFEEENRKRLAETVKAALAKAPESYRRVIEDHFLNEIPIEDIAERYYAEIAEDVDASDGPAVAAARKKARNRADQHLTRGKRWLKQRLADLMTEDGFR